MRLRIFALVVAILFSTTLAISPAYASDPDDDWVTVSGAIWIDENVDGIRQPSEPGVPGATLEVQVRSWSPAGYSGFTSGTRADDQGKYRYPWTYPEARFSLTVFYLKPGSGPVKKTSWGVSYTHFGHTCFYVPSGNGELTLDIRVLHHSNWRVLGGESRTSPPLNWPLADGHFFKETAEYRYQYCDAGFAVTNAGGIPFWETLERLGVENIGYPISHRFISEGFITQEFEKATFQWQTNRGIFRLEDYGDPLVIRTEKAVLQWREDVPWAKAGQVKIMSGGRMGIDGVWLGSVPEDAKRPQHVDLAGLP